ncbi:ISL3 family transposase [Phototrophicus methaneseepsis]|uniref:ISL3 family transposase n=1 Tax=Phototrophicus methaneseepsis TaxID=2710758 RepID=A0A7S8IEC0_9CHLR|nr:ISL3 family transposase [Phototrophicus methaneseepsis]
MTSVQHTPDGVHISVESQSRFGYCPSCGAKTQRIHNYYERQLLDLPLGELAVRLRIQVKRFRCMDVLCERRTFAEKLPNLTERYSRYTKRLAEIIWHVGQVVGGRPGSQFAHKLRIQVSRHSILRMLRHLYTSVTKPVRILGVDDWAKKRGQTYGTILVDLEDHRVIDLLPDREAQTLANWLHQHPTVAIVTRDRSTEYAIGITAGAPQALQVADRWHLLKNLTEMAQRALRDEWTQVRAAKTVPSAQRAPLPRAFGDETTKQLSREHRLKQYGIIQHLKHKGYGQRRIARLLGFSRGKVRSFYETDEFPERKTVSRPSQLDPYLNYLNTQMSTRKVTAKQLWQEIVEQGYPGSYGQVSKWVTGYNKQRPRVEVALSTAHLPGRDTCLRLLVA